MIVYTLDCKEILFKIMIEKISYLQPYEENVEGEILKNQYVSWIVFAYRKQSYKLKIKINNVYSNNFLIPIVIA